MPLLNGLPNGKGKKYFKDGRIFEGNFINGKKEGYGTIQNKKGVFYSGQYQEDARNGKRKEYYENGNIAYEGNFVNNNREGYGKEYYENGKLKYEGNFVNDKYDKIGKYFCEDGEYYFDGQMIKEICKENFLIKTGKLFMKEIFLMINMKVMENLFGKMDFFILENGLIIKDMEKE